MLHRAGRRSHQFGPRTAQAAAKDRRYIHTAAAFLAWVAGALVLLFGIALARVLHLTTTDVTFSKDVPSGITFGKQPIPLPPKIAAVVAKLINDRGRPATTPISLQALSQALTRNGITAHLGRTAAMLDLAADIPAAVLADLLGMSAGTTDKWNRLTSRDRTHYLEARTDRDCGSNGVSGLTCQALCLVRRVP
ncbi:hypothetical protein [Micromonospora sp. NPDC005237]|uniref:hypothetical protein n=1 Tax=Micromonospora sp. NPDC005237 TaxID=3155113 RepID=UPI0033A89600